MTIYFVLIYVNFLYYFSILILLFYIFLVVQRAETFTPLYSSAASDVFKGQVLAAAGAVRMTAACTTGAWDAPWPRRPEP